MLFDLHNDYITANNDLKKNINIYNENISEIIFAIWTSAKKLSEVEFFNYINDFKKLQKGVCYNCRFAIEDLSNIDIDDYDKFFSKILPAYVSLTWNSQNKLAGGVGCLNKLTKLGKVVLDSLSRYDIPLDLAHLNDNSFYDIVDYYNGRIIISHTACRNLCGNMRNATNEQMKIVSNQNGIIGVFAVNSFLNETECPSLSMYVDHIIEVANVCGIEHVAIGSDFCGTAHSPRGFESYNDIDNLLNELTKRHFTQEEINKILYFNAHNFFELRRLNERHI